MAMYLNMFQDISPVAAAHASATQQGRLSGTFKSHSLSTYSQVGVNGARGVNSCLMARKVHAKRRPSWSLIRNHVDSTPIGCNVRKHNDVSDDELVQLQLQVHLLACWLTYKRLTVFLDKWRNRKWTHQVCCQKWSSSRVKTSRALNTARHASFLLFSPFCSHHVTAHKQCLNIN